MRIVKKAAAIIRQDIQSEMYDSRTYPPGDEFLRDAYCVTPTLRTFLEDVMMKNTKRVKETNRKCVAIGHAITSVVRPRTFLSSVLSSLSLLLYRRFASKHLINVLASLGFCSSYYEAQVLEMSCIANAKPVFKGGSFNQFVFDNADFNVCTIDGLNTFHSMGGIRCITPASSIEKGASIPRLMKMPTSSETGNIGVIPLETFQVKRGGLRNVIVENLEVPEEPTHPPPHDTLWLFAQKLRIRVPQWKGFMNTVTKGDYSEKTKVVPLPFINAPPSDYDTVYTALMYAAELCERVNQHNVIITFDQPLYWKAREIVSGSASDPRLSKCVVRLGGFHLLMSYIGCMGYLMGGSGLKELLSTVYAPTSVEKMLQGHAFARAVRGHLITQTALSNIIFEHIDITDEEQACAREIMSTIWDEPPPLGSLNENPNLKSLAKKFGEALQHLSGKGRTAKLWVQYFHMVNLMKEYIHAERSGDWDGHLNCVKRMLPYFHACGHFPYSKSSHLYVQDMTNLSSRLTSEEHQKFVNGGAFTMRRSDRFWSGVWSDMTIETNLMRSFSAQGGVKRGRGVTDSVISKWVVGMSATHDVCTSLEEFCDVLFTSSEQHRDFGEARITKDMTDIAKLTTWLENHPPFPEITDIMSIATGVVGDDTVNCYDAVTCGKQAMNKMVTLPFSDVKLSRKDRALPISSVTSSIKLHDENVAIDPLLLFQRISISKKSDEDLKEYLRYELAPFPLALFNENGMRKTKKSVLFNLFEPTNENVHLPNYDVVIDGGFLLHKVIWQRGSSVSVICDGYVKFIKIHYPGRTCTVVFDGYNISPNSTKAAEQGRRYRMKKSLDIHFTLDIEITVSQELFLSNHHNKDRLINLLRSRLQENGITTQQASDDADVLIVSTAIQKSMGKTSNVAVIGEDIDLAVILIANTPPDRNILFMKPGRGKVETNVYSTHQMQQLGLKEMLFLHAFTGCDSTSATFRRSKQGFIKLYQKHPEIRKAAEVFHNPSSLHAEVEKAGQLCMLKWYGAPAKESSLNTYRYHSFLKSVASIRPDLSSLPPSEGATKQHSFRTFHQVQLWLGNQLPPELWGWELKANCLAPVFTIDPVAPKEILDMIFCRCATDCSSARCSCKKMSMNCSPLCHNCQGNCLNGVPVLMNEDEDEEDMEPLPTSPADTESDIMETVELEESLEVEPEAGPSRPKRTRQTKFVF